jgi:alanine dehydrogenase
MDKTQLLTVGVIGKSLKKNEKRLPIHPDHISMIPSHLRSKITFEKDYGLRFGMENDVLAKLTSGRVASREEILSTFDCVLMPKPLAKDLAKIREGTIVWGWPHCVQQKEITQVAIDRKLTLIAWEEMFTWSLTGDKNMHIFYKNNELAGYAGVNHALSLTGISGLYGKPLKIVVISFGSVSRGAIYALQSQGFQDITILTNRPSNEVKDQIPGMTFKQMKNDKLGDIFVIEPNGNTRPLIEILANAQIIINGILQDSNHPKMFVPTCKSDKLMKNALIIDISCDEGMGFWCAKPTSFEDPMFYIDGKHYYAVDHTPSYYWNSATWEISKALLPFLPEIMNGANSWNKNKTISKAIEIYKGTIQNSKIISFQNREEEYPHNVRTN